MQTTDRGEFDVLMRKLCAGFDRPPSSELSEAFWDGCKKLSLRQFRTGVDVALETFDGKFPRPKQLAKMAYDREGEARLEQQRRERAEDSKADAAYPKWLQRVNGFFFSWMYREITSGRRKVFGKGTNIRSIPDRELAQRRAVCRQLAQDFEQMEREGDSQATDEWLKQAFDNQMRLIAVSNPA